MKKHFIVNMLHIVFAMTSMENDATIKNYDERRLESFANTIMSNFQ